MDSVPLVVHLANSGRVHELLVPGTPALLVARDGSNRKTQYDMLLVRVGDQWVSADARLPNPLVREAFLAGRLSHLARYARLEAEVRFGHSRLDFLLSNEDGDLCLVETKSVTLVEDGVALFPDAPTERGRRHLMTLMEARRHGHDAAIIFVVQRADAHSLRPYDGADPAFGQALRQAAALDVSVLAYRCSVTPHEVILTDPIAVAL